LIRLPEVVEQAQADAYVDRSGNSTADTIRDAAGDGVYLLGGGDDVLIGLLSTDAGYLLDGDDLFKGGSGNDRYINIGDNDVFVGGEGAADAVLLQGAFIGNFSWSRSQGLDDILSTRSGSPGAFLKIGTPDGKSFYLSEVEYLEFAGDGTRINLASLYSGYGLGALNV
jgi:hypothetical protein